MRLEFDVGGYGHGFGLALEIFNARMFKFGRDDLLTVMFCRNLNDSFVKNNGLFKNKEFNEQIMSDTAKASISRTFEKKSHCKVIADVWVETKNNRRNYFCKISNTTPNGASVGTLNCLPFISRLVYGYAYLLKKSQPPKGYEPLKGINIIKNYEEDTESVEMISIDNGKIEVSEKYKEAHKEEIEELQRQYPEAFKQNAVDNSEKVC